MKEINWVLDEVVQAIHSMLIAEHGGENGLRDSGILDSTLSRVKQRLNYEPDSSIYTLAAAYSFGLAKNHPFIDDNKRTAFTIGTLFLEFNGYKLNAPEPNAVITFENLAMGEMDENTLANWFEKNSKKV